MRRPHVGGMLQVDPTADRRSCGILGGLFPTEEPVDRAASVEIAQNAIPTPAWTAPNTRRPQRPTRHTRFHDKSERRKITRSRTTGRSTALEEAVTQISTCFGRRQLMAGFEVSINGRF